MSKIVSIKAREILASGSSPSLECEVTLESGVTGEASVPYGASAGMYEATVLLDGDKSRYNGKGMLKAVANINEKIAPLLVGQDAIDQRKIDQMMRDLDGTENKSNLGGNAILGVSLAVARAMSLETKTPLYKYIRQVFNLPISSYYLPNPMMVVIEGGKHAHNSTDLQEYIVSIVGNVSAKENVRMGVEIYTALRGYMKELGLNINVGNEGAFAPSGIGNNEKPLELILEGINRAGYIAGEEVGISIDAAASEFYENGKYNLSIENKILTSAELIEYYMPWFTKYPITTFEDMLDENDWANWTTLTSKISVPNIADDLTVTNVKVLQRAIDEKAATSILIKLNQIGTLTETVDCCMLARKNGFMTVVSHRGGGETNDTSMVDLAVAVNSGFIKVGPTRGERVCKYNRLMRIEEELGSEAKVMGSRYREIN